VSGRVDRAAQISHFSERDTVVSREEYLRFAAECWAIAETMDNTSSKAQLLAMAAAWRKLAEFVSNPDPDDKSQDHGTAWPPRGVFRNEPPQSRSHR